MSKCPKCRDVELASKTSMIACDSQVPVVVCPKCKGTWVKSKQLDHIHECSIPVPVAEKSDVLDTGEDLKTGLCPEGHGLMTRAKVDLNPHFYLERCSTCGGIWFDKGELNRVVDNHMVDNLSMIWTMAWQRTHRLQKGRQYYLDANKRLLGDDIFEAIMALAVKLKDHPEKLRALSLLHQELNEEAGEV